VNADPPPANIDAEKAILGAILLDNNAFAEVAEKLTLEDFFLDSHRRIWRRVAGLIKKQRAVDIVTLANELTRRKEVESIGGRAYLFSLTEGLPRQPRVGEYCRIVKERATERAGLTIVATVTGRLQDRTGTPGETLAWAADQFAALAESGGPDDASPARLHLRLKCADKIIDREQGWLVNEFLPDDTLTITAGQVGLGKTTACLSWAAAISNGRIPIIGGKREPANVLMLSNEDSEAQLRRIFTRLGGNLSRLYVEDEDADMMWGLGDSEALDAQIADLKPALVIIDSLTTHKPTKCDLNSHGDVAPLLVALRKLASKHCCAICVIHHLNKMQTSDPLAKISGSIGISATARHVIVVAPHPEDPQSRVAAIAKTNLVRFGAPSYRFRLDPFDWEGTTQFTAPDILQIPEVEGISSAAEVFLRSQLADGPKPVKELEDLSDSINLSRTSLYRAKKKLNIESERSGWPCTSKWRLPAPPEQSKSTSCLTVVSTPPVPDTVRQLESQGELSRDNNNNYKDLAQLSQLSQLSHVGSGGTTVETTANRSTEKRKGSGHIPAQEQPTGADSDAKERLDEAVKITRQRLFAEVRV
jgi:hypothetical protein